MALPVITDEQFDEMRLIARRDPDIRNVAAIALACLSRLRQERDEHWAERLGGNLIAAGLAVELVELCETVDGNGSGPVLRYYAERLGIACEPPVST